MRRPPGRAELDPRIARLAIAFAPIYREPKTARLYPDLRRRLVATIFDALLRACAAFLARSGAWSPPTHQALGRRVFVEAVERVDRRIDQIARSFDFLLAITPINADAARQEFRSSRFAAAPRLLYRPLTVEVDVEKRRLFSIPFGNLEDPLLYDLYRQKQQELDLMLTMIAARETAQFRETSRVLYGSVEPALLDAAKRVLAIAPTHQPTGDPVGCHHVRREAHRMIRAYRAAGMRFPARVSLRSDVPAGLMVSGPAAADLAEHRHAARSGRRAAEPRGRRPPLHLFRRGRAGSAAVPLGTGRLRRSPGRAGGLRRIPRRRHDRGAAAPGRRARRRLRGDARRGGRFPRHFES